MNQHTQVNSETDDNHTRDRLEPTSTQVVSPRRRRATTLNSFASSVITNVVKRPRWCFRYVVHVRHLVSHFSSYQYLSSKTVLG
ncbi:unnamed protein product [Adineta ricciae]|nr:unnamed protein product [Adineta ricciae]